MPESNATHAISQHVWISNGMHSMDLNSMCKTGH